MNNRLLLLASETELPQPIQSEPPLVGVCLPLPSQETLKILDMGTVAARTEVNIVPEVAGRVTFASPNVVVGSSFVAGEVLFRIDDTEPKLRKQQAEAELANAESLVALEVAEAESARAELRLVNGDAPIPDLVARRPQLQQARSRVALAAAHLSSTVLTVQHTEVSFPFAGQVISSEIEQGASVVPNQPYGTVYSDQAVQVNAPLSADDIAALNPAVGREALVVARVGRSTIQARARITRIGGSLDQASRLRTATLTFEEDPLFVPGTFVEVEILGPSLDNGLAPPASAVSASGSVWVVEADSLSRRQVDVIARTRTEVITQTFNYADGVVTVPPAGVREGLPVRIEVALRAGLSTNAKAVQ